MNYYLLKSKYIESNDTCDDNHIMIHTIVNHHNFCLSVNTKSNLSISHMHYLLKEYSRRPSFIPNTKEGIYKIEPLHYFQDHLVNKKEFICDDLKDFPDLKTLLINCKSIISIGEVWTSDNKNIPFGFYPDQGMHDIHANDNLNDGLLCLEYEEKWIVLFIYFVRN